MFFLYSFVQALSTTESIPAYTLLIATFASIVLHRGVKFAKKQKRKLKWQFIKQYIWQRAATKKKKADGTTIFLLLLMIIACAAILWVLWALGGIFALILGIVFGVGILTLIFRK